MIRVIQTFGAHAGRVLEIDREVVRFGRLPENDVAFDPHADLDASGRHAELRHEGAMWVLCDVGSRNGTLVGGKRITRYVLRSGDEIEFGMGGPRVRIELDLPVSAQTAQATPLGHHAPLGSAPGVSSSPGLSHPTPPPSPFAAPGGPLYPASTPAPHLSPMAPALTPPPGLPPPGPPPGDGARRYGQKTVGMMIQAALHQAEQQRGQGANRSTAFLRAVATEAAQSSSRGLKIAVALLSLVLFLTLGAVVAVFFYARWQEEELRDENVRLQRELAALGEGETAERGRLEQRIQDLNEELSEQQQAAGTRIADRHEGAVWALIKTRNGARRTVLCTAFAVRPNLLATNAHCVGEIERAMSRGEEVAAVANRGQGGSLAVDRMWRHPAYVARAPASPDVGLVRVRGTMPQVVELAQMSELTQLRAGDDVFLLGFPEVIAEGGAPVAGLTSGVVGRVTAFDGTEVPAPRRHLVSHSAFTDGGTVGSPLFDREGRVVAINAGNYRARQRVVDANTRVARTVDTETPYAWAVRADLLLQLLAGLPNE